MVELCRNPWACRAYHCSGCLHSAGNNKKGSLLWSDESQGVLSLVWPVSQTADTRVWRQVVVGRIKLFYWNKHNIADTFWCLQQFKEFAGVTRLIKTVRIFWYVMSFPSKMQWLNLQCTYLPTRHKFCVRAASETGENYFFFSYPQAQKANEVFVLYRVSRFFAANCLISAF